MYKVTQFGSIINLLTNNCIPIDENNKDYQQYRYWISLGNIPEQEQEAEISYDVLREEAYRLESDPLFYQEQRGEVPSGTWLAKVNEIKLRYPKSE